MKSAERHRTDGRDFKSISHLEGWRQGREWDTFVPSDNKETEKTKASCQTCARVNGTERWFCCNLHQGGPSLLSSCPEVNGINHLTNCFSCLLIFGLFSFSFFTQRAFTCSLCRQLMGNSLSFHSPCLKSCRSSN